MAEQIGQHVSGFSNWLITKHAQSYLEAFEGPPGGPCVPDSRYPPINLLILHVSFQQHCMYSKYAGLSLYTLLLGRLASASTATMAIAYLMGRGCRC